VSDDDLAFNVDKFMAMAPQDRARVCMRLALRAQALAESARDAKHRRSYLVIAEEWLFPAHEMQRAAGSEK
jgi:hypothetical protein